MNDFDPVVVTDLPKKKRRLSPETRQKILRFTAIATFGAGVGLMIRDRIAKSRSSEEGNDTADETNVA